LNSDSNILCCSAHILLDATCPSHHRVVDQQI
jgi:hypothetical protein